MQRVMITGGPGSGKSTLARIMGQRTGLPVYHMDQIHWMPGWVARPDADKIPMVLDVIAKEQWVFEGGNSVTYPDRVARADTFIWLDLPVSLRFYRVVWRTIRDRGTVRPDMAPDCPEGFHGETWDFWKWIWRTRNTARAKLAAIAANPGHMKVHHLTSRSQVAAFIANLPAKQESQP
ncbi:AAA family ATPase [Yoonia sp. BS5-3]|uniref:AAA family ATPase n=1 Tax=Yoonia phaeophyticola TaxID=3137369 RepID=A0ABZ2V5Q6_9RHOB